MNRPLKPSDLDGKSLEELDDLVASQPSPRDFATIMRAKARAALHAAGDDPSGFNLNPSDAGYRKDGQ